MPKPLKLQDKYFKKAKEQGLRARSYFKLDQIDERLHLLRKGMHVLDLGAAPGSFLQYLIKAIGESGYALGIDLTPIKHIGKNVETIAGDINAPEIQALVKEKHTGQFDVIVSDLAPKTSGVKDLDHWRSVELSEMVLHYADDYLKKGGACLIKIFQGSEFDSFLWKMKKKYTTVKIIKPDASRDRSKEVYLVGMGKK